MKILSTLAYDSGILMYQFIPKYFINILAIPQSHLLLLCIVVGCGEPIKPNFLSSFVTKIKI
jgi:hypothetical protein